MLAELELIHHIRKLTKDFEFIYDLGFVRFWAYISKLPMFIEGLDSFLQNMRKYNDMEKIQIDLDQSFNDSKLSSSGVEVQTALKKAINASLKIVFKLFFRMSNNMESDKEYFSIEFYRKVIADREVFDTAKLLDIAAIYGQSNHRQVKNLVTAVFEAEPKLLIDFKDSFDMMLNIMKRTFKDALRTDQMIRGDAILQKTRSEQDEIILRLVHNLIEMLGNFSLITLHFGELTMEQIANTNFMVYLANSYCMLRKINKYWLKDCTSDRMLAGIKTAIELGIKLCIEVTSQVIGQGIVERINQHSKNYAMVQNKLG